MGLGAAAGLFGAASGTPRFRPHADLRDCYTIQAWAMIPTAIAAAIFDVGVVLTDGPLIRIEVAILIAAVIIGLIWNAWDFRTEAKRLTEELHRRVEET